MKKLLIFLFALMLIFCASPSIAKRADNNISISSATIIGNAGISVYVIDMRTGAIDPFQYVWDTGVSPFSFQLSGVTCAYAPLSGATINFDVAESNYLPSGTERNTWHSDTDFESSLFQWTPIISDLAYDSGNTKYVYPFFLRQCRYMFLRATSGITTIVLEGNVALP
uniref:Uncharacterized protein n=1 Tax=viral metagenome TaxID=1070528 RepID=A0A6M3L4S6_9ZZZZ